MAKYYKLGIQDARKRQYPLYAVLIAAEEYEYAEQYAKGWFEVTEKDLRNFRDG